MKTMLITFLVLVVSSAVTLIKNPPDEIIE